MTLSDLLTPLLIGLLGAGHCLGMCGPLASGLLMSRSAPSFGLSLNYNFGRLLSYMAAGTLAGAIASTLPLLFPAWGGQLLRLIAALLMVLLGLYLLRLNSWLQKLEHLGQYLWRRIQPLASRRLPIRRRRDALLAGVLWGWLPCGLVYSALSFSASSGSALSGAVTMLLFGLGTLPAMLGLSLIGGKLHTLLATTAFRLFSGCLMIAMGGYSIAVLGFFG